MGAAASTTVSPVPPDDAEPPGCLSFGGRRSEPPPPPPPPNRPSRYGSPAPPGKKAGSLSGEAGVAATPPNGPPADSESKAAHYAPFLGPVPPIFIYHDAESLRLPPCKAFSARLFVDAVLAEVLNATGLLPPGQSFSAASLPFSWFFFIPRWARGGGVDYCLYARAAAEGRICAPLRLRHRNSISANMIWWRIE